MLKEWYKEYISSGGGRFFDKDGEFIIYKGFKITLRKGEYEILDVRSNDFYTSVRKEDLEVIKAYGFTEGCDRLMHTRDLRRISGYQYLLDKTYRDRDKLMSNKGKTKQTEYNRKLRILNKTLLRILDKKFFYEARAKQCERKHNIIR